MKHKAWFFYLIIILIVINLASYLFFKYGHIDQKVKQKISTALGNALNANVSIEKLSLNDKQLNITKLKISAKDKSFYVCSKQIYVEYNLFSLVKNRFKNFRGISLIKIYNPNIKLTIKPSKKNKKKKKFKMPVLRDWFKRLEIVNGSLNLKYKTDRLNFSQKLQKINVKILNKRKSIMEFCASGDKNDSLSAKVVLKKSKLKNAFVKIYNYQPSNFNIKDFKKLKFATDISVNYQKKNLTILGKIRNVAIKYRDWELDSKSLDLNGNKDEITIGFGKVSTLDGFLLKGKIGFSNYLKNPVYKCDFSVKDVSVEKYAYYVFGKANANVKIKGEPAKPKVYIKAFSKKLKVETETFENVYASADYMSGKFRFFINDLIWEKNHLSAQGYITKREGVVCTLQKKSLKLSRYGLEFAGNLIADMQYKKKLILNVNLKNLNVSKGNIRIKNLSAVGKIVKNNWQLDILKNKNINLIAKGNFKSKNLDAKLKLKHLRLSEIFDKIVFPITSGDITFRLDKGKLLSDADIIFYDQDFGKFDGEIIYDFSLDKKKNRSQLNFKTKNARYNFEPFSVLISANGTADSIGTQKFVINDKVNVDANLKFKPEPDFNIKVEGNNIYTTDILRYFSDYETMNYYKGSINFLLSYSSLKNRNIEGVLTASSLSYNDITGIDAYITFFGNKNFFTLDKMLFYQNSKNFFAARGNILFKPRLRAKFVGKIKNLNLAYFLKDKNSKGKINGDFTFDIKNNKKIFNCEVNAKKIKISNIKVDTLNFAIVQKDKILNIKRGFIKTEKGDKFTAKGKLGYNIFSQNFYPLSSDTLKIDFVGDLLNVLKSKIKSITDARSKTAFGINLFTNENGLNIAEANLKIKKGFLKIKNQPVPIDKISVDMYVKKNKLKIRKFKLRIGDGYLQIKNKIGNGKEEFVFANVNLGKFFVKTDSKGILLYIPGYVAEGSFLKLKIEGRDSDYLKISGPFDDLKIKGDLIASNGNLVYPPNTDNLLKIIKNPISAKQKESETIYPFSLDLMLKVGENVHYTTYPINLLMRKGGYLNLLYKDGVFSIPDAFFVSEKGDLNIFGTDMIADYVSVKINKLVNGFKLNGEFYKDIPDGTRVTMIIYTENQNGKNKIRFKFLSDHPGDSTMDIISMLRYGKRIEEINPSERNTLLQDELVQIAGLSIENAFISPLFYPFENFVKHFLRLDYFNIKTGIVQNVFNRYYNRSNDNNDLELASTEQDKITKFGMDMFLNNLTLQFTKHIYKKTFLDYSVSFQRSANLAIQSKLGIYQNISLKIEIPYKFRLSLDYKILPFNEKNSYQIGIEKSVKFY